MKKLKRVEFGQPTEHTQYNDLVEAIEELQALTPIQASAQMKNLLYFCIGFWFIYNVCVGISLIVLLAVLYAKVF